MDDVHTSSPSSSTSLSSSLSPSLSLLDEWLSMTLIDISELKYIPHNLSSLSEAEREVWERVLKRVGREERKDKSTLTSVGGHFCLFLYFSFFFDMSVV